MKTTTEYFKMSNEDLQRIVNEYGYTREEAKLFDSAFKVILLNSNTTQEEIKDAIDWHRSVSRLKLLDILKLTDNRIAVLLD